MSDSGGIYGVKVSCIRDLWGLGPGGGHNFLPGHLGHPRAPERVSAGSCQHNLGKAEPARERYGATLGAPVLEEVSGTPSGLDKG